MAYPYLICMNVDHFSKCEFFFVGPAQRAPRRPREATKGKQLDKMTKAMGRRLPITVEKGKKRPHEPVQAAKFASEAGLVIRESMHVLTHWKDYKKDKKYYEKFVADLSVSALLYQFSKLVYCLT